MKDFTKDIKAYCVCLKSKPLCICRFSPSSSSPRLLRNIGEFGAKKYFTNNHTRNCNTRFLEIQFRSVKCTTVTVGYAKISSNIPFLHIQAMQAIRIVIKINYFKKLLNIFGTTYTYSNCIVYRLFYC